MQVDGDVYELGIAPGHYFDVSPDGQMAAVVSIHEDAVYLVDLSTSSSGAVHRIPSAGYFRVGPNPGDGEFRIIWVEESLKERLQFERLLSEQDHYFRLLPGRTEGI